MDALYFRVSSDRQTVENQFEDVIQAAERGGVDGRDWNQLRQALANCILAEQRSAGVGPSRPLYRLRPEAADELTRQCVYVEQGKSGRTEGRRPLFERMKRDAVTHKFDRLLVWKVSRLGRDMREVIATVYELADLGIYRNSHQVANGPFPLTPPVGGLACRRSADKIIPNEPREGNEARALRDSRPHRSGRNG